MDYSEEGPQILKELFDAQQQLARLREALEKIEVEAYRRETNIQNYDEHMGKVYKLAKQALEGGE